MPLPAAPRYYYCFHAFLQARRLVPQRVGHRLLEDEEIAACAYAAHQ